MKKSPNAILFVTKKFCTWGISNTNNQLQVVEDLIRKIRTRHQLIAEGQGHVMFSFSIATTKFPDLVEVGVPPVDDPCGAASYYPASDPGHSQSSPCGCPPRYSSSP